MDYGGSVGCGVPDLELAGKASRRWQLNVLPPVDTLHWIQARKRLNVIRLLVVVHFAVVKIQQVVQSRRCGCWQRCVEKRAKLKLAFTPLGVQQNDCEAKDAMLQVSCVSLPSLVFMRTAAAV